MNELKKTERLQDELIKKLNLTVEENILLGEILELERELTLLKTC